MASSPDFHIRKVYCSSCGTGSISGFCEFCDEEIVELPSIDDYNVFDESDDDDE